jgi:hypothetical protein
VTETELKLFPIGDFHILSEKQSSIFADYLNLRTDSWIVLLGDVIHFANSIWNSSFKEMSRVEMEDGLERDVAIWEDFLTRLTVPTIYYLGSHELFALTFMKHVLPSRKLDAKNELVVIPRNLQIIKIGGRRGRLFLTGIHIPENVFSRGSDEFAQRKADVERWLEKQTRNFDVLEPEKTILCTHDPCDNFYRNMGYREFTQMLSRWDFKVHYHAHIHSNIRKTVVGKTPSINRSFIALSKWNREALEPTTREVRSLYGREI